MSNLVISGGVTLSGGFEAGFGAGGGGGPTLSVTSGLNMWFKADSLALSDGAPVSTWADEQGGAALTSVESSPWTGSPTYVASAFNGKPAVRNSSNAMLRRNTGFPTDYTFFLVMAKGTGGGQDQYPIMVDSWTYNWNAKMYLHVSPATQHIDWGNTGSSMQYSVLNYGSYSGSNPVIVASTMTTGSQTTGYFNGTQAYTRDSSQISNLGGGTNTDFFLFDAAVGGMPLPFYGDIAELIVYNRVLTTQELADVHSYLGTKYGISV